MSVFYGTWKQLHHLDVVGLCESGLGALCESRWCDSEVLCLWVLPLEMFPWYTALVNCELSKHFSLPLHTGHTLPDSFLNSVFPQK